jgi:hypothetical protein
MKAAGTFEISVNFYQTTRRCNTEDGQLKKLLKFEIYVGYNCEECTTNSITYLGLHGVGTPPVHNLIHIALYVLCHGCSW